MKPKRHAVFTAMVYALAILSAAAGMPKILQMPQELDFLSNIGFANVAVSVLGIVQFVSGILLFSSKFRLLGAYLAAFAFLTSSIAIFAGGNATFGLISLLPCLVSLIVIYSCSTGKFGASEPVTAAGSEE